MKMQVEARIRELSITDRPVEITGNLLRGLTVLGVYVFFSGAAALYVGKGKNPLTRFSRKEHENAARAIQECGRLHVYQCATDKQAAQLEALLIAWLQPRYNKNVIDRDIWTLLGRPQHKEVDMTTKSFKERICATEKVLLIEALEKTEGNRTKAAKLLKMTYRAFRHFAVKHAL